MAKRTRTYATIVYPDSAPEGWLDTLREAAVMGFISPLHDSDKEKLQDDSNGVIKYKKPHYHVMIMYDGVKSDEQFDSFKKTWGGVGTEPINSTVGYARYLCHLDNPEKYQYNTAQVISLGGADYYSMIGRTSDRYQYLEQMLDYIREHHITDPNTLIDYSQQYNKNWFRTLMDGGFGILIPYIKGLRYNRTADQSFKS